MLPGQAMQNSEYEYDRRTKPILEVRGKEIVLVGVRFSSPAIVLQSYSSSSSFSYSFLPLAAKARMWAYLNPTS
jgi:hypothetical protein